MKKIIIYTCSFVFLFFLLPAIFTTSPQKDVIEVSSNQEQEEEKIDTNNNIENVVDYDYQKYKTVKLIHKETNLIEELNIDEYLYGVVASEMPVSYELEALKAQAIVARTYTIYQMINNSSKHENADICNDFKCCQAWISKEDRFAKWEDGQKEKNWQKIIDAVNSTKGKIITYEGKPINAFFHSNSGGVTESSINVWGGIDYPYLKPVETSGEEGYTQYSSEVTITKEELQNKMKEKYSKCVIDYNNNDCIKILEFTTSGRVKTIKIGNIEIAGTELRTILGLKSTNFNFAIEGNNIKFYVIGYGHGVGMSQTGADVLAKEGKKCDEIIKHFYTNVEIIEVNSL